MILSFGEIEALSLKAARGAGLAWGLAEETGKAVRWLSERGLPGPESLAAHLPHIAGTDYAALRPQLGGSVWRASGEALCPLVTGASLADHAGVLARLPTLGPMWNPLLLLPFAARAAERLRQPLAVEWGQMRAVCGAAGIDAEGDLTASIAPAVAISRADHAPQVLPAAPRPAIDKAVIDALQIYARRTYVPASRASRLAGAGAGANEND